MASQVSQKKIMAKFEYRNCYYDAVKGKFIIKFSFDAELFQRVKSAFPMTKRKYDTAKYEWLVDSDQAAAVYAFCTAFNFNIADSAKSLLRSFEPIKYVPKPLPDLDIEIDLKRPPMDYQAKGIAFNIKNRNVLIGDVMGLGKTFQAQASVVGAKATPTLILCPAHLKYNWKDEFELNTYWKCVIMNDDIKSKPHVYLGGGYLDAVVINYQSMAKYLVKSMNRNGNGDVISVELHEWVKLFKAVIVDEVHECSNMDTQRFKIVDKIMELPQIEMRLTLTGTPIKNKMTELCNELQLTRALHHFGGRRQFLLDYCGNMDNLLPNERENKTNKLQSIMNSKCYYRREKHEVLKDLPDKFRQVITLDITNFKEYQKAENDFEDYLKTIQNLPQEKINSQLRAEVITKIMHLSYISAIGKLEGVNSFIKEVISEGEKFILFCHRRDVIDAIRESNPGSVCVIGGMKAEDKDKAVKAFQNDPNVQLIIVSIEAGSTGLTLTASSKVGFIELPWNSAKTDQCEDRAHRIGQKDTVNAYYFLGNYTYDQRRYGIIEAKRAISKEMLAINDPTDTEFFSGLWKDLFSFKK